MKVVNRKAWAVGAVMMLMLLLPAVLGILLGGQAGEVADKGIEIPERVGLYMTDVGEIKQVSLEEYVVMAMLAEVPADFDSEALKAMAVAVRSYTARRLLSEEKQVCHYSADLCDDPSHCLGAVGWEESALRWGEERADVFYKLISEAVWETKGQVLLYGDMIADTVFHTSSYGCTESAENVWGFEIPYLVSVKSGEDTGEAVYKFSPEELSDILKKSVAVGKLPNDPSEWLGRVQKNENGRISVVELGGRSVTGRRVREIFGLPSACFDVDYDGEYFVFRVRGEGHGVGMSQYGCQALAEKGMAYTDVLAHYYPSTSPGRLSYRESK